MLELARRLAQEWDALLFRALRTGTLPVAALTQLAGAGQPADLPLALDLDLATELSGWLPPFWQGGGGPQPFVGAPLMRLSAQLDQAPAWPPRRGPPAWERAADGAFVLGVPGGIDDIRAWASGLAELGQLHAWARRLWERHARGREAPAAHTCPAPAELACAWGCTSQAMEAVGGQHPGLVAALAAPQWPSPRLWCPPGLRPGLRPSRRAGPDQLLAEQLMALRCSRRPVHLWLGPSLLPQCLSPAARDLGAHLPRFVAQQAGRRAALGPPPAEGAELENWRTAAAEMLATSSPDIAQERRLIDRSVGIARSRLAGWQVAICDTALADLAAVDPRVRPTQPPPPPLRRPLVVVVDGADEHDQAQLLMTLVGRAEAWLASITVLRPALLWAGGEQRPSCPPLACALAGGGLRQVRQASLRLPADLCAPAGSAWLVPAAGLCHPPRGGPAGWAREAGLEERTAVASVGDGRLLECVDQLQLTGRLGWGCRLHWVMWPGALPDSEVQPPDPNHGRLLALSAALGARLWQPTASPASPPDAAGQADAGGAADAADAAGNTEAALLAARPARLRV